jgi:hypothetical protein
MSIKLLRTATLSLCGAAGAMLAVGFLPHGVAAADPEDLFWSSDDFTFNPTSDTQGWLGEVVTGTGELDGGPSPFDATITEPDALQASETLSYLGPVGERTYESSQFDVYDITGGDAALGIPTGSTIEFLYNSSTETAVQFVDVPRHELFGLVLPFITESIFTPAGETSFSF